MNYEEIFNKFSNVLLPFYNWYFKSNHKSTGNEKTSFDYLYHKLEVDNFNDRDLFDFFDDNDLHITINPKYYNLTEIEYFCFWINDGDGDDYPDNKPPLYGYQPGLSNRKETEEMAFMKCFKILNDKLKK